MHLFKNFLISAILVTGAGITQAQTINPIETKPNEPTLNNKTPQTSNTNKPVTETLPELISNPEIKKEQNPKPKQVEPITNDSTIPELLKKDKKDGGAAKQPNPKTQQPISNKPILNFSQALVREPVEITQLKIFDNNQLKISGIKEEDIFNFVHHFKNHAQNIFHNLEVKEGRIIYGIIIKPSLESATKRAKELNLDFNNPNVIDDICKKEPTHCSSTTLSSFHNKQIPENLIAQFEKDIYMSDIEIFWPNYRNDGELKFFFEISLKNTI